MADASGEFSPAHFQIMEIADSRRSILLADKMAERLQEIEQSGVVQDAALELQAAAMLQGRRYVILNRTVEIVHKVGHHHDVGGKLDSCPLSERDSTD